MGSPLGNHEIWWGGKERDAGSGLRPSSNSIVKLLRLYELVHSLGAHRPAGRWAATAIGGDGGGG